MSGREPGVLRRRALCFVSEWKNVTYSEVCRVSTIKGELLGLKKFLQVNFVNLCRTTASAELTAISDRGESASLQFG